MQATDTRDDIDLLREYATQNSESAFETLVTRRLPFVYAAALRQVRDPHMAQEVTQAVFVILAQKAARMPEKTILTGWLFKTTRFVAMAQTRRAARRGQYEREAQLQSEIPSHTPDPLWEQMSPHLDEALAQLGQKDRQAVLLRFFENKSLADVGRSLGTGEDTARMRIGRALEKLRRYFRKRGLVSTTAIIAGVISVHSSQAAPPALAKSITAVALTKGAAASGSTLTLIKGALKIMAWSNMKTAVVVAASVLVAATGTGTGLYEIHQNSQKTLEYFPRSTWMPDGFGTPEATIKSFMWAKSAGDIKAVLNSATPEMRDVVEERYFKNKSDQQRAEILIENVRSVTGVQIQKKMVLPEDEVAVQIHFDGMPSKSYSVATMKKIDGEWKVSSVEDHN